MRKYAIALATLLLCVTMLCSCSGLMQSIGEKASLGQLDSLEAEFSEAGYTIVRADEAETNAFCESLVAETGLILDGKMTGKIEYQYTDSKTGEVRWGMILGTTGASDAKAIAKAYQEVVQIYGMEINAKTYYVQIEYTFD